MALSRFGALDVLTDNGSAEHSLACGALCEYAGIFCMNWLLVVVRGPGDLDGRRICGASSVCRVPIQSAGPRVWHDSVVIGSQTDSFSLAWAPKPDIFIYLFIFIIWGPPQKSGPNPMSFQFLTRGTRGPHKVRTPP